MPYESPKNSCKTDLLFDQITIPEKDGVDVTLDSYPYLAGSTYLHALLPSGAQADGSRITIDGFEIKEYRLKVIYKLSISGSDGNRG